ncbi:phosphocholine cytidylyltransferase family protein [Candidatus Pseudothioglobus singularis]|jgi:L-glutamine-phosphate cytidylyltransferase|nr:phosphocholine cytidylyltransferase family protein [Candidatus Pseudothioglobus singularis]
MIAILISAGKGSRMYPLTANTPKCLIDIGKGKTVLESQLDVLQECGITKVFVVAGYLIEQVRAKINGYKFVGMEVEVVHNPFFDTSNNIVSLWLASLLIDSECISINGDDVFKSEVINALLGTDGDVVMTTSVKKNYDSDDMLVIQENKRVISVGKDLDPQKATAESVGIIKYSSRGLNILRDTIDNLLRSSDNHQKFYLHALQNIMDKGITVNSCNVDSDAWAEIDFHPDIQDVRNKIDYFVKKIN